MGEGAGVGHPSLVDDEQAAARETAALSCFGEQAVESAAGDVGFGGEIGCRDAGRGGAEHHGPVALIGVGEGSERGRLTRPGVTDHADDPIRARPDRAQHRQLLATEHVGPLPEHLTDGRCRDDGRSDVTVARRDFQRDPLVA